MQSRCPRCGSVVDARLWWCSDCGFPLGDRSAVVSADEVLEPEFWRDGSLLVLRRQAQFPDRCVKSNGPADGNRVRLSLSCYPPNALWARLGGRLVFLVVALSSREDITLDVGISRNWMMRRQWTLVLTWSLAAVGLALVIASNPLAGPGKQDLGLLFTGAALFVGGVLGALMRGRIVSVAKRTNEYIWLDGVHREFLSVLPRFDGDA